MKKKQPRWTSSETSSLVAMLGSPSETDCELALGIIENNMHKLPFKDKEDDMIQALDNWIIKQPWYTYDRSYSASRNKEIADEKRRLRDIARLAIRLFLGKRRIEEEDMLKRINKYCS